MTDLTQLVEQNDYSPQFTEKKPFFSEKEIILRTSGRAVVFRISSGFQFVLAALICGIAAWNIYSNYMYHKSGRIITHKDRELVETRDAYVDLMSDFVSIRKNVDSVLASLSNKNTQNSKELDNYKRQALAVEDKIKQMTAEKDWVNDKKVIEKMSLNEAVLQRDMALSERDELRRQLDELEEAVKDIRAAEMDVFARVEAIALKEVNKIKRAFNSINVPLKQKGQYFNPLANSKKRDSKGGTFVPASTSKLQDKKMTDKISSIYNTVDYLEYFREVVQSVPIGKPVWSYWMSSKFGYRSDPFNKKKAGHKGVDLASRTGNKILVKANGRVTKVQYSNKGYGNNIVVDHGNGFITKYAHMHKIYVKKGDYVKIDDALGEVGNTGRSTGPHLHYEILYNNHPVDPLPFMQAKLF